MTNKELQENFEKEIVKQLPVEIIRSAKDTYTRFYKCDRLDYNTIYNLMRNMYEKGYRLGQREYK